MALERVAENAHPVAGLERWRLRQPDNAADLALADVIDDGVSNTSRPVAVHEQPNHAGRRVRPVALQLDQDEAVAGKQGPIDLDLAPPHHAG